ncbi:prepilin-type N-terminal cleavage/methylation domain-containing protein [Patescibacteria group bacterium]
MKNKNLKKGFSLPEVIIAITIIVLIIVTATNLLVSSIRANTLNTNKIIAYNLAQEAIEGVRNIRDNNWIHNQYWRGTDDLFGSFTDNKKYIIKKNHNLKTVDECKVLGESTNTKQAVKNAAPWLLVDYSENLSQLYFTEDEVKEYSHESTNDISKFRRYVEIKTIPYDLATQDNEDQLKISVTAVVEWLEKGKYEEFRLPTVLTDWKAGPL